MKTRSTNNAQIERDEETQKTIVIDLKNTGTKDKTTVFDLNEKKAAWKLYKEIK